MRLTFEDALKIAMSIEAATAEVKQLMWETQDHLAIHRVGTPRTAESSCYTCRGWNTCQTIVDLKGQFVETE